MYGVEVLFSQKSHIPSGIKDGIVEAYPLQ